MPSETLKEIMTSFSGIAKLHKKDLQSTQELPFWNASFMQLLKFERQIDRGKYDPSVTATALQKFMDGTFAEMRSELPKMVEQDKLQDAEQLYDNIQANLALMVEELNPAPRLSI